MFSKSLDVFLTPIGFCVSGVKNYVLTHDKGFQQPLKMQVIFYLLVD